MYPFQVDIDDLVYLVEYLFVEGPAPVCMPAADIDWHRLVDISDVSWFIDYLFSGGPPLSCPATGDPIDPQVLDSNYVYRHFENHQTIPADTDTATLRLVLVNNVRIQDLVIPIRVQVGTDPAWVSDSDTAGVFGPDFIAAFSEDQAFLLSDSATGRIMVSAFSLFGFGLVPGSRTVLELPIHFPSAATDRPLTLEWATFPPVEDTVEVNRPMFQYDEVWADWRTFETYIGQTCCLNRGNVDGLTGSAGPVDVADLTYLIQHYFTGGPGVPCVAEGGVDGIVAAGQDYDIGDLNYLVAYLFEGGPPPPPCRDYE